MIYVSHRMDETMRIADRATILRDGKHAVTAPIAESSLERIAAGSSTRARLRRTR